MVRHLFLDVLDRDAAVIGTQQIAEYLVRRLERDGAADQRYEKRTS